MAFVVCAPERIRTPNPRSRNPIFYPVELRVQNVCKNRKYADKRKQSIKKSIGKPGKTKVCLCWAEMQNIITVVSVNYT